MKQSKSIVLIHGLFVNNRSWSQWKAFFEAKGYTVYTPVNPGHDGDPAVLRNSVDPILTRVGFKDVVMNIADFIDTLPEKPIVIGHSLAGLVVQKLVEMDKAVAGVSIDGAPPKNVFAPFQTIKTVLPVVNFFKGNSPFLGSREWYRYAFFNTLSEAESEQAFAEIAVPESRLAALRKVPAAELKIDRGFVADLESSADARSVAATVISMAHQLGLRVVAEGVENDDQRDWLLHMQCNELQGYLFAKPMSATALGVWASGELAPSDLGLRESQYRDTLPQALAPRAS